MTVNFNPRLRALDVGLVLGALILVAPIAHVTLHALRPDQNNTPWSVRIAFLVALAVLFVRGNFFGPPDPDQPIVEGGWALAGLAVIGVGGTLIALGALLLLVMSSDLREPAELFWLLIPMSAVAIGSAFVFLGTRLRTRKSSSENHSDTG